MINRPSTDQILRDVAEELNREIMPLISDTTDQIRLHMIVAVINQCAARAGREIAVMKDEGAKSAAYGAEVAAAAQDDDLAAAVAGIVASDDLTLEAVAAEYARASDVLGTAIEVALDAGLAELVAVGEDLLRERITHEQEMSGAVDAGR